MIGWKLNKCIKGMRPLVVLPDWLIFYKNGGIYKTRHDLLNPILICFLPTNSLVRKLTKKFHIFNRILRSYPSHAIIFNDELYVAQRSEIWRCDINNGNLTLDFKIPDNRRALSFSIISNDQGSKELVFGEYFDNSKMEPVRIWGRKSDSSNWSKRAEFNEGEINHIHSLFCSNSKIYILTGDFEQASGIWVSDLKFSTLKPLLRGKQSYRYAWMEKLNSRIYMANDSQLETNQLYEFKEENDVNLKIRPIISLNGSSIYVGRSSKEIFFSTTVEPGEPTGNFIRDLLDTKLGPGILSSKASLMSIDEKGLTSEIYSAEKDYLPFRLAQLGTFIFPSGTMPPNTIYAYGIALKDFDGNCLVFHRQKT
jgi:hypothetical protein